LSIMYVPQSQVPQGLTKLANGVLPLAWAIRTRRDPMSLRAAVTREFVGIDPTMQPAKPRTMEQVVSESLSRQTFNTLLLTIFAAGALLLATIGIYGLMSYSVEQRMQEIGIRVALGATRSEVLKMIVLQGMTLTWVGVGVGLAAAFWLTRFLASQLYNV